MNNQTTKSEIIGTRELMSRLNLSEPTIIRYRKKGKIPFLQVGSAVRYEYEVVLEALRKGSR